MAFAWIGAAGMSTAGRVGSGVLLYAGIDSNSTSSSAGAVYEGAGLVIGGTGAWTGRRTGMAFAWIGAAGISTAGRVGSGVLLYTGIDSNLTSSSARTVYAIMVLAQEK